MTQKRDGKASGSQQLTATTGDDGAGTATFTGVVTRHTRRLRAAHREEGAAALTHGNRGRRPANAMPDSVITRPYTWPAPATGAPATPIWVSCWVSGRVLRPAGPRSGVSSVGVGLASPRRRRPPARRIRRQRMPREGMPVQLDGSHHRWLEDRGPGSPYRWRSTTPRPYGRGPVLPGGDDPRLLRAAGGVGFRSAPSRTGTNPGQAILR